MLGSRHRIGYRRKKEVHFIQGAIIRSLSGMEHRKLSDLEPVQQISKSLNFI
jgi:hypothetical protein